MTANPHRHAILSAYAAGRTVPSIAEGLGLTTKSVSRVVEYAIAHGQLKRHRRPPKALTLVQSRLTDDQAQMFKGLRKLTGQSDSEIIRTAITVLAKTLTADQNPNRRTRG